ncbi:MAG TPA: PTS sugar transporter subunit IIA [Sediminispirochaeta sp.]|nr:PTS sugar transporter subunit IIA [Sediminispirochaeta sp.]
MIDFSTLLLEEDICELQSTLKYDALHELISGSTSLRNLPDSTNFEEEVKIQEQRQSTGIGKGVAIAHATTEQVKQIKVALGVSRKGIEYQSIDGQPVYLLFLVANPPNSQIEYLSVLSALVRLLRQAQFRQSINSCTEPCEIKELLDLSLADELSA